MLSGTESMAEHPGNLWSESDSIQGQTKAIICIEQKEQMSISCLNTKYLEHGLLINAAKPYRVQKLLELSKSCFALRCQDACCVNWFANVYRRDRRRKIEDLSEGVSEDDIRIMLLSYMVLLNKLFFFGLLTMDDQQASGNRFVTLKTLNNPFRNAKDLLGEFTPDLQGSQHRIDIYTYGDRPGEAFGSLPLGHLLGTLAHEMVHAYMYLFADQSSAEFHHSWNNEKQGHCQVFWALLNFIMEKLVGCVPECKELLYQQCKSLSQDNSEDAEELFEIRDNVLMAV